MDLMVLADALLLPARRSGAGDGAEEPAVRTDDEDLFELAWSASSPRRRCGARQLAAALRRARRGSMRFARAAQRQSPFAFYAALLGAGGGRKAFWRGSAPRPTTRSTNSSTSRSTTSGARRRRCKALSPGCAPRSAEVKRDMEIARDEVRVMTVHGAKGLEAPIVILADTTTQPAGPASTSRGCSTCAARRPPRRDCVWAGREGDDVGAERRGARARPARRRGRISPAALCGDDARRRPPGGLRRRRRARRGRKAAGITWSSERSCRTVATEAPADFGEGKVLALSQDAAGRRPSARRRSRRCGSGPTLPAWLERDVAAEPPRARRSRRRGLRRAARRRRSQRQRRARAAQAMARGTLVHRLMQSLPDVPPSAGWTPRERFLARNSRIFTRRGTARAVEAGPRTARRSAIRGAVRARQPRRNSDRRAASAGPSPCPARSTAWRSPPKRC